LKLAVALREHPREWESRPYNGMVDSNQRIESGEYGKAKLTPPLRTCSLFLCGYGYGNVDLIEGRVDNLTGLNLRGSIDQF